MNLDNDYLSIAKSVVNIDLLKNKRIFITGGTGFFGKWLLGAINHVNKQYKYGVHVTILSRNPNKFINEYPHLFDSTVVDYVEGDIKNFTFPQSSYDFICHLATTSASETFSGEDQLEKINLLYAGTKRVLDFAILANVKKVLFTSSGVVYGGVSYPVSESYLGAPNISKINSSLGEGKRLAEYLLAYYNSTYGLKYSVARCFSFIGPYLPLDLHYAAGNFIADCLCGRDIIIQGDGTPIRSYLYMSDCIVWLLTLLLSDENTGTYNVGSEASLSILDLAVKIKKIINSDSKIVIKKIESETDGNFSRNCYVPDCSLIKNKHRVVELVGIDAAIERTFEFSKK